ncbi:MAG: class I SAM-dependent methyltransferase [Wenzhouxiangellaceae bacterium]|nr:class I SAM-dependent methyltransferase [Wenzhouxiangellaceae bacterium]
MLERTPEPELMDLPAQVEAYAAADFSESNQTFVDVLARQFQPRPRSGSVLDLGCGPGDICLRMARALPGWKIVGVDAGQNMLERARADCDRAGLSDRVRFVLARLPDTDRLPTGCPVITSNSLLHHLPDPQWLWQAIRALAAPGAWVQVMDLARPESREAVDALVQRYAAGEPAVLREDFANSLHAAWRVDEIPDQLAVAGLALDCRMISDRHWLVSGFLNTAASGIDAT